MFQMNSEIIYDFHVFFNLMFANYHYTQLHSIDIFQRVRSLISFTPFKNI